ncbi:MAG: preprotein translocase subunit SecY [Bacteroidia bacterium]|nr:preprotein translocase subunit SecY [Bacteroidia bacterium]
MKGLIETLRNIFKITELRNRILYTLLLLLVYRLGSFIILPGINSAELAAQFSKVQGSGILGFLNTFVGGAFARGSIFALGIMPYISASIIVQILGFALPEIQKLQKQGDSGIKKINQITRYLAVLITAFQAAGYVVNLRTQYPSAIITSSSLFWVTTVFVLTAGTMFLVWLGERITDNGIGNGVSLIIMIGIISELPMSIINEFRSNAMMIFFVEIISLAFVTMAVILMTQATRKIPINYARRMMGNSKYFGGQTSLARDYIPLKLNASGVMPIIFAQSIMFIPATISTYFSDSSWANPVSSWFGNTNGIIYNVLFALMIVLFTYFYTAIAVNPRDIAEHLKRNGGFIPGVKPGEDTTRYIDDVMTKITLPGSLFLALVAIMPAIVGNLGVSSQFAQFFGGTSLLILIGVVLDTLQQIEQYLLMRHYDGLTKSGSIKGKTPVTSTIAQG